MSADAPASVSPLTGCRVSSTDTSWHMIKKRLAVTSSDYCWKISLEQERA